MNYAKGEEINVTTFLNVELSSYQNTLLNPTVLDTIIGHVMKDAQGE